MHKDRSFRTRYVLAGLLVCALLGAQATRGTAQRVRLGTVPLMEQADRPALGFSFKPRAAGGNLPECMEVVLVLPDSLAERAGIRPGDLVLSANGAPVPLIQDLLGPLSRPGTVLLKLWRNGSVQDLRIVVPQPDPMGATASLFAVPGLKRAAQPAPGINTLRTVFIDPKTGTTAFIGAYDPAYATGPIDYAALLGDALRSPYPAFSLDPSPATKSTREALLRKVDADMSKVQRDVDYGKAWMLRIGNLILSDASLSVDRQRFLQKGAEALKGKQEQARALWDIMNNRLQAMDPRCADVFAALFEAMGDPDMGRAMRLMSDPNTQRQGFEVCGLGPLVDDLRMKLQTGALTQEQVLARGQAALWERIMKGLKIPASQYFRQVELARTDRMSTAAFQAYMESLINPAIADRVMLPWLNGLVLSQAFLERFYQVPSIEVVPRFLGGLPPDSELARTFLAADWMLKMLAIAPELSAKVPGHLTYQNYEFRLASSRGTYAPDSRGSIRGWLAPQGVDLRCDPSGRVVTFGPSRIAVRSELTTFEGGSRSANALERDAAEGYAREVTQRYDDYARALPELHRLREAAKVIALVRWARQRSQTLAAPAAAPGTPLPPSFRQGFWTATFQADANKILFVLSAHGGVDFDQKTGDAWVQPKTEAGLADSALKQLVGSAALAQQAAGTALKGDMEGARELAQKSEQAMIGDLRSGFPTLAQVPQVPDPTAFAVFQGEALAQSKDAIAGLKQAATDAERQPWQQKLQKLQELMAQGQQNPALAPKLAVELRQGIMGSTYAAPVVASQASGAPAPSAPPVAMPAPSGRPPVAQPPARPQPAVQPAARPAVPPEERARILAEISQLRKELCRIQANLRKFNATIQSDQAQRAEWEQVTNEAYQRAVDEVKSRIEDELKDLSTSLPEGYFDDKLAKAASDAEKKRLEASKRLVQHLKESYALQDFSSWASYEDYGRDEILEGARMVGELTGLDEWLKNKLVKKWGLGRVLAFGEAAQDIVASAYDVTSEILAWRRLNQLNRNSAAFLKAVEAASKRMKTVMEGIHEREVKLGLPPGASREVCP